MCVIKNFPYSKGNSLDSTLNVSYGSCQRRAKYIGVERYSEWSEKEEEYLRKNYKINNISDISAYLKKAEADVLCKSYQIEIRNISVISENLKDELIFKFMEEDKTVEEICKECDVYNIELQLLIYYTKSDKCKRKNKQSGLWKGKGDIYGSRWSAWKTNAKNRDIFFNVSIDYGWALFLKQKGRCAITGVELNFPIQKHGGGTASLDRIDSSKGYIEGNVQWVHKSVNVMKQSFLLPELIEWCKKIVCHHDSKRLGDFLIKPGGFIACTNI